MTQTFYVRNPQEFADLMKKIEELILANKEVHTKSIDNVQIELSWNDRNFKMTMKEFQDNCQACGGNWTAMLASGVKKLWPVEFEALPEKFDFKQIMEIVSKHVDIGENGSKDQVVADLNRFLFTATRCSRKQRS